jgi:hypothetical protein
MDPNSNINIITTQSSNPNSRCIINDGEITPFVSDNKQWQICNVHCILGRGKWLEGINDIGWLDSAICYYVSYKPLPCVVCVVTRVRV